MTAISNIQLGLLLENGSIKTGNGGKITFNEALKQGLINDGNKAELYEYAKAIFKDSKKALSKHDDNKAMEALVRAYTVLTSKNLAAGPKAEGTFIKLFGSSELREQARMVKESKKIFADHRESYLKAKLELVKSKATAKGKDVEDLKKDTHEKISMLETLTEENIQRMEPYMKEFGPKVHNLWKTLKQQLTDKKLGSFEKSDRTDSPQTAVHTWNKLRTAIADSGDGRSFIASVFKGDDQVLTDFLTGKRNLRSLVDPQNQHAARVLGQIDNLERACKGKPKLEALFHKLEVALLHQSSPNNIRSLVLQIAKESKNHAIYESIYRDLASSRPLTALSQNIDVVLDQDYDTTAYEHILGTLRDPESKEKLAHAANLHVKTPSAPGIEAHTVTIGTDVHSTNTVVSAAPKNAEQAKAYFENLERNNSRIIVNLHEDYEQKMGGFLLYPKNVGEEIEHGDLKIKKRGHDSKGINGTLHGTMVVDYDVYEVTHNGQTVIYPAVSLKGLSKEDTPIDPAALRVLSKYVNNLEQQKTQNGNVLGKGHLAITSTDGTGRAGAFLLYHELANRPAKAPLDTLDAYFQYTRTRPPLHEKQFASVIATLAGQITPVKSAADPAGKIASKLLDTPDAKFMTFFLKHDEKFAKELHKSMAGSPSYKPSIPGSTPEDVVRRRLEDNIDRKLFHGVTDGEKRRMQQEIAHFGPEALSKLFFVLTLPQRDVDKIKNNLQLLNSKHNAEFHNEFNTYQHHANPTLSLLKSRIQQQERDIPEVDLKLLHRLDAVRQKLDVLKDKERNHIYEIEKLFVESRTDIIQKNRIRLNNPETLLGVPVKDRQMLGKELIHILRPAKIDQINPSFFRDLTDEQRLAISTEQAKAMTDEQWKQFFEGIPNPKAKIINQMDTVTFIQLPRKFYTSYLAGLSPTKMHALVLQAETKRPIIHDGKEHETSEVKAFIDHIRKESAYPKEEHTARQKLLHELAIRTKEFGDAAKDINDYAINAAKDVKAGRDTIALGKLVDGLQHYANLLEHLEKRKNIAGDNIFVAKRGHIFYGEEDNDVRKALRNLTTVLGKLDKIEPDTNTKKALKHLKKEEHSNEIENILRVIRSKTEAPKEKSPY